MCGIKHGLERILGRLKGTHEIKGSMKEKQKEDQRTDSGINEWRRYGKGESGYMGGNIKQTFLRFEKKPRRIWLVQAFSSICK